MLQNSYQLAFITKKNPTLQETLGFLCSNSHIRDAICQLEENLKVDIHELGFDLEEKGFLSAAF